MRNALIKALILKAKNNRQLSLIVGDLGYSVVESFENSFPDQFINVGVAEQNMIGIASGMASEGFQVFTYSIANFPIFRCAEHIRNDIDYHNLPVTIIAVGGGVAYGNLGYSHHAVQDFSFIRSLINMIILAPADPLETSACIDFITDNPQPSYLRINKSGEKLLFNKKPCLKPGELNIVAGRKNNKKLILTTGAVLELGLNIWESNKLIKKNWMVASLPIWGEPLRSIITKELSKYKKIIVIEEHLLAGGFGSFLRESGISCEIMHLENEVCNEVGSQNYLKKKFGLNINMIFDLL
tara:strand:+ start:343 stop:1233 length:891 start_codon:yes stop_codon:yes gene_type:complete